MTYTLHLRDVVQIFLESILTSRKPRVVHMMNPLRFFFFFFTFLSEEFVFCLNNPSLTLLFLLGSSKVAFRMISLSLSLSLGLTVYSYYK